MPETTRSYEIILKALKVRPLLTEHELTAAVANELRREDVDIQPLMPDMLGKLRFDGLVWAGELTNSSGQKMFAACLTEKGKLRVKYG